MIRLIRPDPAYPISRIDEPAIRIDLLPTRVHSVNRERYFGLNRLECTDTKVSFTRSVDVRNSDASDRDEFSRSAIGVLMSRASCWEITPRALHHER